MRFWIVFTFIGIFLLMIIAVIFISQQKHTSQSDSSQGLPSIKEVDLAPHVAMNEKTTLIIRLNDSSEEKIILPTTAVDGYIHTLPQGEYVISRNP